MILMISNGWRKETERERREKLCKRDRKIERKRLKTNKATEGIREKRKLPINEARKG
jgi:hypothetical protein